MTELSAGQLRQTCDPDTLPFKSTEEVEGLEELVGQDRALDAIRLSATVEHKSFNVFALGPSGTGRHSAVMRLLKEQADKREVPSDWVYVNNFEAEHKPRAIRLPAGTAPMLRHAMEKLVDDLASDIPALFESDEYQTQRRAIEQELGERQESAMTDFAERARSEGIAVVRTPMGYMLAAMRDGDVLKGEDYEALPEDERNEIDEKIARLQEELAEVLQQAPKLEKERRDRVEELNASMAERAVSARIEDLREELDDLPVEDYIAAVKKDIIANAELFLQAAQKSKEGNFPQPETVRGHHKHPAFDRYGVNVMVTQEDNGTDGAPVETEELPNLDRLIGRVEHMSQMGSLVTNFTMIKPGALHRANGGYLVLDARRVLTEPYAWDSLKRCLRNGSITITSIAERLSMLSTISLEPDPIPLDVRVVLIGDRMLHALLVMLDPDFDELFKVQADFEESVDRDDESQELLARLVAGFARKEELRHLTAAGVARVLDEATRLADDTKKLSLRLGMLADLMREANHYAAARDADRIDREDIQRAVDERDRRASRIKDRMREAVARGTVLIDTEGGKVGQINGLSVIGLGDYRFGRPSRITARIRMGSGKLVDIEREVELGGPLHSKGVMILSGYLTSTYAPDVPFSLHASLVFEQSYGGVDGDSASSAELYALLSALSGCPIDQGLAVTGSVNQIGQVQAIGGVNEKIEGFFETCKDRGLTGTQGVLIPKSNVDHLMLRQDVVEAAEAGEFRVIPVETIDEGIAILTGTPAGARGDDGAFPADSINGLVEARLRAFAENRREYVRKLGGDGEEQGTTT